MAMTSSSANVTGECANPDAGATSSHVRVTTASPTSDPQTSRAELANMASASPPTPVVSRTAAIQGAESPFLVAVHDMSPLAA